MIGLLKDLLGHQAWADAAFFRAWEASSALDDEDLRARTAHLVEVQEAFLAILRGGSPAPSEGAMPDWGTLKARCRASHDLFRGLGRALDGQELARIIRVPWFPDPPCLASVGEILTQVCLHTQHHRAQNMTRLKALGAKPRNVDYLIWVWKQRPDARWEA